MRVLFHFECSNGVCKWISTKELVSFFMVESWILGVPTRKVGDCCARKVGSRLQEYLTCRGSILQQTWPWKFVTSMEKMCIKYYKTINAQETFGVFFLAIWNQHPTPGTRFGRKKSPRWLHSSMISGSFWPTAVARCCFSVFGIGYPPYIH